MTTSDPYDDHLRSLLATIDRCGWSVQAVGGAGLCSCCGDDAEQPTDQLPPFCYTVGLTERGLPELLLVGGIAGNLLNGVAARLAEEGSLAAGRYTETPFNGYDFVVLPATEPAVLDDFVLMPQQLWPMSALVVLQVIRPDDHNRMPWEPGCSIAPGQQPLLSTVDPARLPVRSWCR